jgi:hypothetical protein
MSAAINDTRRFRIFRVKSSGGEMEAEPSSDIWQDPSGRVIVSGIWEGILFPSQEDLSLQATALSVSPLEYARQRLLRSPFVRIEVLE